MFCPRLSCQTYLLQLSPCQSFLLFVLPYLSFSVSTPREGRNVHATNINHYNTKWSQKQKKHDSLKTIFFVVLHFNNKKWCLQNCSSNKELKSDESIHNSSSTWVYYDLSPCIWEKPHLLTWNILHTKSYKPYHIMQRKDNYIKCQIIWKCKNTHS